MAGLCKVLGFEHCHKKLVARVEIFDDRLAAVLAWRTTQSSGTHVNSHGELMLGLSRFFLKLFAAADCSGGKYFIHHQLINHSLLFVKDEVRAWVQK
jgi:hypothetical protein